MASSVRPERSDGRRTVRPERSGGRSTVRPERRARGAGPESKGATSKGVQALALLVALATACAPRHAPPAPSAPVRPQFVQYPAAEVAAVADPHDYRGKPLCQRCHAADGHLLAARDALCTQCHQAAHGSHPLGVHQRTPPAGLPLAEGGRVACDTCHDPHEKAAALRKPFDALCLSCHEK